MSHKTTPPSSQMRREILEIPTIAQNLMDNGAESIIKIAHKIQDASPATIVSVARGSSDHVCTYLKYVSMLLLGLPFASIGPSIASVYRRELKLANTLCLAVSQSGQSPDLVAMLDCAQSGGAMTLALTNQFQSPMSKAAQHVIDIRAGNERSVAATKSFINSAIAGVILLAEWSGDVALTKAVKDLPEKLAASLNVDWGHIVEHLTMQPTLYTLGRGPSLAIADEAALKFKETCLLHAESYSAAELFHGPISIVKESFPIIIFADAGPAEHGLAESADLISEKGGKVFITSDLARKATVLERVRSGHPLLDSLCLLTSFYNMVETLARARGFNPDKPPHLKKVTETR